MGFETKEPLVTIHHDSGPLMNWTILDKLQVQKYGYDDAYPLEVLYINKKPYGPGNQVSTLGDTITLSIKNTADDNKIISGDLVIVYTIGPGYYWKSSANGFYVY